MRKNTIITNKEKIIIDISSTIKDLKRLKNKPNLGKSKRARIRYGLKIWTGRSPICETNKDGLKPCQVNKMDCLMSYKKEQGCQNLEVYLTREKRDKIPYIEMYLEFWKKLKSEFKSLSKESFHKKEKERKILNAKIEKISAATYLIYNINKKID